MAIDKIIIIASRKPRSFRAGMNALAITVFRGIGGKFKVGFSAALVNLLRKPRTFSPRKFIRTFSLAVLDIVLLASKNLAFLLRKNVKGVNSGGLRWLQIK